MKEFDMPNNLEQFKDFRDSINGHIAGLMAKHQITCEGLTEKQLAESITQAIACGDFIKQIHPSGQAIIYIPFAREQELLSRIEKLEAALQDETQVA